MTDNLARPLALHAQSAPDRLALAVAGQSLRYAELAGLARRIAGWLLARGQGAALRVGVLAGRSVGAYAGVVGAFWAGATYVPFGLHWPEQRLRAVLQATRLDALIVDAEAARQLTGAVRDACPPAVLVTAAGPPPAPFDGLDALPDAPDLAPVARPPDHVAYIIFTSGTTGPPKGVQIGLAAIGHHLAAIQDIYRFVPADRISLAPDLTFDPSVLNMLMTWNAGASLHVVPGPDVVSPIGFIRAHALSVWNSVPTIIAPLLWLEALQPGVLDTLRISIFGGDTLTAEAAQAWQRAAPHSVVDNVYGPTEATIECLHQRLTDPPIIDAERGTMALGLPYPGNTVAILDEARQALPAGVPGELAIAGAQLAHGYLDQPDLTAARFPIIDGVRWYLTGDLAYQDAAGRFHHLGRVDDQIKLRGYRVELGEIESHLRQVAGTELVAAVGWPLLHGQPVGIVGFIAGPADAALPEAADIRAALQQRLPTYCVPRAIHRLASLPYTVHGKLDRRALVALLAAEA